MKLEDVLIIVEYKKVISGICSWYYKKMDQAFEEMQLDCHENRMAKHDRCLCEDCLIQNFSYFGHYDNVLEKRPKRKSVTSIDEAYKSTFKESRLDSGTLTQPVPWCPAFGNWGAVSATPNMYTELFLRYGQGREDFFNSFVLN